MMKAFRIIIVISVVAIATIENGEGQTYHFSNGWHPGKRSMQEAERHFRQEVQKILSKIIKNKVRGMLLNSSSVVEVGNQTLWNLLKKKIIYDVPLGEKE